MRLTRLALLLMLAGAATAGHARAPLPGDAGAAAGGDGLADRYAQQQRERFELLRNDGSPRLQALAGSLWLDRDDPANRLLPAPEDVLARAVGLAPDDAFVQWQAADQGKYSSNRCGPTRWPETEVTNLTRLEPDNAAAWQYAVALAQAKGDAAAVDAALAHMAAATRAQDHRGELALAWSGFAARHPQTFNSLQPPAVGPSATEAAPAPGAALLLGLQQAVNYASGTDAALEAACRPGGDRAGSWQRLGWCVQAGTLLASKGNSLALRERGLALLEATGAGVADIADLRREFDWLRANAATPQYNPKVHLDPATLVDDWRGVQDEVAATGRRLARLGLPPQAPAGWVADAESERLDRSWQAWVDEVTDDLGASRDPRERALALQLARSLSDDGDAPASSATLLADLAAAHPGAAAVQWLALRADPFDAAAIAALQRLEPGNPLSAMLVTAPDGEFARHLQEAVVEAGDGAHVGEWLRVGVAAFARHPLPPDLRQAMLESVAMDVGPAGPDPDVALALGFLAPTHAGVPGVPLLRACEQARAAAEQARVDACVRLARHLLHRGTTLASGKFAAALLRALDALDPADATRARQVQWLDEQAPSLAADMATHIETFLATGSELEALQRTLARSGQATPPAQWQPRRQR